jgi:hypothetical protein
MDGDTASQNSSAGQENYFQNTVQTHIGSRKDSRDRRYADGHLLSQLDASEGCRIIDLFPAPRGRLVHYNTIFCIEDHIYQRYCS